MSAMDSMHIRAVIPHYFAEDLSGVSQIGQGYGSRKKGGRLTRLNAVSRCLHGLLNLRRSPYDFILDLREAKGIVTPQQSSQSFCQEITIEIILVVFRDNFLRETAESLFPLVKLLAIEIDDPRWLGLSARDWLINHPNPADLNLYLEDDLVIHDPLFADKIIWFAHRSSHHAVLMPHRYEYTRQPGSLPRLFVDGPIDHQVFASWHNPISDAAMGTFLHYRDISFDIPSNPHSGFFGVSKQQIFKLREIALPRSGFIGPLETAATYTVGHLFKLFKPSMRNRDFLTVEHASPSYLGYLRGAVPHL